MSIKNRIAVLEEMDEIIDSLRNKCDIINKASYYTDEEKIGRIFALNTAIDVIEKAAEGV